MFAAADLPAEIPVFPLPGVVLFPRARLPLQIFEPRYLAMLDDVLKTAHRLVGMIQPLPGTDDGARLHEIGCAGRLTAFSEIPDRRYLISLTGVSRFRIRHETGGLSPYRKFAVSWEGFRRDLGPPETDPGLDRPRFMKTLDRYLEQQEVRTDRESLKNAEDEMLINALSMHCPFAVEDRQALLEAGTLSARREVLEALMAYALHGGAGEEGMQ